MLPTIVAQGIKRPLREVFPGRLRKARRALGISASALSDAACLGRGSVFLMEGGKRLPRISTVVRLAAVLQVPPALLAFGDRRALAGTPDAGGLPARLVEARAALGMPQRDIERRTGIATSTVRALEEGGEPTLDTVEALAEVLAVSPAWLAFGMGDRELLRRGARRAAAAPAP